ncbi:MAG TPA: chemotaxis protein CheW [Rhodanobacteraceae bacterium]|nr:chemotaxis protein CheW [Rhodanobacteraceae bacterium]
MPKSEPEAGKLVQQLTFILAGEEYGIDILSVREIRAWSKLTRIPQTPAYVLGVLNLRGAIVPVIDLRLRFGLPREGYDSNTVTVVAAVGNRLFGVVADSVADVFNAYEDRIKPVPDLGAVVDTRFLKGLAGDGERMIMLLDLERLMRPEEAEALDAAMPEIADVAVAA